MPEESSEATSVYQGLRPRCTRLFKLDPGDGPLSGTITPLQLFHSLQNNDDSTASSWRDELRNLNVFNEEASHKTFILWDASAGYDALSYSWNNAELVDDLHLRRYEYNKYDYLKRTLVPTGPLIAKTTIRIAQELRLCLLELRRRGYQNWLWIDAVCMNQDEIRKSAGVPAASAEVQGIDEFGHHVPLMSDIYGCAKQAVLWIGQLDCAQELALRRLKPVTEAMQKQSSWPLGLSHQQLKQSGVDVQSVGVPYENDPFWISLRTILDRKWFQRLWTLQESVLAERVMIVGYSDFVSFDDLLEFCHEAYKFSLSIPALQTDSNTLVAERSGVFQSLTDIHHCRIGFRMYRGKTYSAASTALRLDIQKVGFHILLPILQRRQCDAAHLEDKAFGALGLISASSRKQIRVKKGMRSAPLYLAFAKQFIQEAEHPSECLLDYAEGEKAIEGLPSWCPDLSVSQSPRPLYRQGYWSGLSRELEGGKRGKKIGFHSGFDLSSKTWCPPMKSSTIGYVFASISIPRPDRYRLDGPKHMRVIEFLEEPMEDTKARLHVTGVRISRVTETIPCPPAGTSLAGLRSWERSYHDLFQRTTQGSLKLESYCRTLVAQLPGQSAQEKPEVDKGRRFFGKKEKVGKKKTIGEEEEEKKASRSRELEDSLLEDRYRETLALFKGLQHFEADSSTSATEFIQLMSAFCSQRCFFSSDDGRVGLGPLDTRVGDEVCVFFFCPMPSVIRQNADGETTFVGNAFVDGLMQAEALTLVDEGVLVEQEWDLV